MAKRVGTPPDIARVAIQEELHSGRVNMAWIAEELGITRQAIAGWRAVPAEWVRQLSDVTGIPAWRLRPDLYDAPPTTEASDATG
jgi:hypothetical protein